MALWDIIEAIFRGGKKISEQVVDRAYDKMDKMESEVNKYQTKASRMSDNELKEVYKSADGTVKMVYARELKDRRYLA